MRGQKKCIRFSALGLKDVDQFGGIFLDGPPGTRIASVCGLRVKIQSLHASGEVLRGDGNNLLPTAHHLAPAGLMLIVIN